MRFRLIAALAGVLALVGAACGDDSGGGSLSLEEFCTEGQDASDVDFDAFDEAQFEEALAELRSLADRAPTDELEAAANTVADNFEEMIETFSDVEDDPTAALEALESLDFTELEEAGMVLEEACAEFDDSDSGTGADDGAAADDASDDGADESDAGSDALDEALGDALSGLDSGDIDLGDVNFDELLDDIDLGDASTLLDDLDLDDLDLDDFSTSASGLDDAFEECRSDTEADGPGDNSGCDELYQACSDGDMAACNDLWLVTPVGSELESYGATCGNRTEEVVAIGSCESIE